MNDEWKTNVNSKFSQQKWKSKKIASNFDISPSTSSRVHLLTKRKKVLFFMPNHGFGNSKVRLVSTKRISFQTLLLFFWQVKLEWGRKTQQSQEVKEMGIRLQKQQDNLGPLRFKLCFSNFIAALAKLSVRIPQLVYKSF